MELETLDQWLVVVNPNAGIGKCGHDWKHISSLLDKYQFKYFPVFTNAPLHAIDIVDEYIGEGFRKIIVVGGDGTINEVVNGIFQQKHVPTNEVLTSMISVGTGNDWVRTFNIPINYEEAIKIIKQKNTLLQDAGKITYKNSKEIKSRYFVNMAGLGFDGLVAQKTNDDKIRGKGNPLLYIKNLLSTLFSYKSSNASIIIDNNKEIKHNIFSIGIGIGKYNGGGMMQAPNARPDNGIFDLTLIKDISRLSVIINIRRLYNGTIGKIKKVETLTGKHIRINSNSSLLLEADGESLGHSPVELEIIPKSVNVIINHI